MRRRNGQSWDEFFPEAIRQYQDVQIHPNNQRTAAPPTLVVPAEPQPPIIARESITREPESIARDSSAAHSTPPRGSEIVSLPQSPEDPDSFLQIGRELDDQARRERTRVDPVHRNARKDLEDDEEQARASIQREQSSGRNATALARSLPPRQPRRPPSGADTGPPQVTRPAGRPPSKGPRRAQHLATPDEPHQPIPAPPAEIPEPDLNRLPTRRWLDRKDWTLWQRRVWATASRGPCVALTGATQETKREKTHRPPSSPSQKGSLSTVRLRALTAESAARVHDAAFGRFRGRVWCGSVRRSRGQGPRLRARGLSRACRPLG